MVIDYIIVIFPAHQPYLLPINFTADFQVMDQIFKASVGNYSIFDRLPFCTAFEHSILSKHQLTPKPILFPCSSVANMYKMI